MRKTQRLFGITSRHCIDVDAWRHLTPQELSARHISPDNVDKTDEKYDCNRPPGLSFQSREQMDFLTYDIPVSPKKDTSGLPLLHQRQRHLVAQVHRQRQLRCLHVTSLELAQRQLGDVRGLRITHAVG